MNILIGNKMWMKANLDLIQDMKQNQILEGSKEGYILQNNSANNKQQQISLIILFVDQISDFNSIPDRLRHAIVLNGLLILMNLYRCRRGQQITQLYITMEDENIQTLLVLWGKSQTNHIVLVQFTKQFKNYVKNCSEKDCY